DASVKERPRHHEIHPALQVARDVAGGFALPEPDVAGRQMDRRAAELHHADLEGDARAEARLLEDHGERPAGEQRMRPPGAQVTLQPAGDGEDRVELARREVAHAEQVPFHVASARSRMAQPSSTCSRVMMSGGTKRSTRSAQQLMSSPSRRQRSTTGAPRSVSSAPSIRPRPRTAEMTEWRAARARSLSAK